MIYFDNAATTFPKPASVNNEVGRCIRSYCGTPGRGSHTLSRAAAEKIYECREEAASFFGLDAPENVIFTVNTTAALNMAIKGLLRRGDHVLISDMEPSTYVEDKAEVLDIFNTVKNAPIVSYEKTLGSPGWFAAITFYGNDGEKLFGFRVSETVISLGYNVYRFTTEEGYFTEICEFIKSFEK